MYCLNRTLAVMFAALCCVSATEAAKVFYADFDPDGAIRCFDTQAMEDEIVIDAQLIDTPFYVAVHPASGKIYWSEPYRGRIRRANLDATEIETVATWTPGACALESGVLLIDDVNDHLYWTIDTRLMRANLDGSDQQRVYTATRPVYAFDVCPEIGFIYLGCYGIEPNWMGRITRIDLDGANPVHLVNDISEGVLGLVADVPAGRIYYTRNDGAPDIGHIESVNLDGTAPATILENIDPNVLALDQDTGQLYWSIWYMSTAGTHTGIARANLDGSSLETLPVDGNIPFGIAVVNMPENECPEDLNGDNVVDISDLATLLACYGTTAGALPEQGDLDGDGDVDMSDLAQLLSAYGSVCE